MTNLYIVLAKQEGLTATYPLLAADSVSRAAELIRSRAEELIDELTEISAEENDGLVEEFTIEDKNPTSIVIKNGDGHQIASFVIHSCPYFPG